MVNFNQNFTFLLVFLEITYRCYQMSISGWIITRPVLEVTGKHSVCSIWIQIVSYYLGIMFILLSETLTVLHV